MTILIEFYYFVLEMFIRLLKIRWFCQSVDRKCVMVKSYNGKGKQTYNVESSKRLGHGKRNIGGAGELSLVLAPQGIHPQGDHHLVLGGPVSSSPQTIAHFLLYQGDAGIVVRHKDSGSASFGAMFEHGDRRPRANVKQTTGEQCDAFI